MDQVVYRCGDCELDSANRRFTRGGKECPLEPKVFAVLVQLVIRAGELVTRDQLLDAVWGHRFVTPSTLNRVIALARRALAEDVDGQKFIQTVHGAGYRYVGPVESSVAGSDEPRSRFGPPVSARLPARLHTLIGREQELSQIDALLRGGRSVTLLGTGGMGKTQCAIAFAQEHADQFPDGVWFFDLVPMQRAEEWLQALALSLSIVPSGKPELLAKVAEALAGRRALLLLDNCDRLSADVGALVVELLRATDQLKVLATSQQKLNFVGERVLRLPPLGLPVIRTPADEDELGLVAAAPAVALLLARMRDAQTEFSLTVANAPTMFDLCERLDGMPLALELAAARFALLAPEQVLERLDQRFRFLTGDMAGRDPRHRNLIALLEWSFALLSAEERRLLAWLGVFVQGWTVDAAIDLAPAFDTSPESIVDLLTGLANKSLVVVDQSFTPPRYRLLESVREFALEQLQVLGEEGRARDAHEAHVAHMCEQAQQDMLNGRMRERISLLTREHGNIASACEHALAPGKNAESALRILGLLTLYFKAHGSWLFARRLCERALSAAPPVRTRARGLALMCLGVGGIYMREKVRADAVLREAADLCREFGADWAEAYARGNLALWLAHSARPEEAAEHVPIVEEVARRRDDPILLGLAGLALGWVHLAEDRIDAALEALQAVQDLGGDYHQHHFVRMYTGLALFVRGDYGPAAVGWREAMRSASSVGNVRGIGGSIEGCAYIAERAGRTVESCRLLSAAAEIRKRTEQPLFSFWVRHHESAHAALQASLGRERYEGALSAGAKLRLEDAVDEADSLLREFSGGI